MMGLGLLIATLKQMVDEQTDPATEHKEKTPQPADSSDDDDHYDLRYPVTDGRYDPELYRQRGGRRTLDGMNLWNVDYDTYKSNIE